MNTYTYKIFLLSTLIVLCSGRMTFAQVDLEGTWKDNKIKEITFIKSGTYNPGYFILKDQSIVWGKYVKDTFMLQDRNRPMPILYNVKRSNGFLRFTLDGGLEIMSTRSQDQLSFNDRTIPVVKNSFFDFSTNRYNAGEIYDLTPKSIFPFYLNSEFLKSKKVNSFMVILAAKQYKDSVLTEEEPEAKATLFLHRGVIKRMTIEGLNPGAKRSVEWNYFYTKEKLDSIVLPNGVIRLDGDQWPVDKYGYKIVEGFIPPLFWEYKNDLPYRAIKTYGPGSNKNTLEYVFNDQNQLTEIKYINPENIHKESYLLEYDSRGVVTKMTRELYKFTKR